MSPQHCSESLKAPCKKASVRVLGVTQSSKERALRPCPLSTITPMLGLATTSIARRGTISTQRQIIAATRMHKSEAP